MLLDEGVPEGSSFDEEVVEVVLVIVVEEIELVFVEEIELVFVEEVELVFVEVDDLFDVEVLTVPESFVVVDIVFELGVVVPLFDWFVCFFILVVVWGCDEVPVDISSGRSISSYNKFPETKLGLLNLRANL